MNFILSNQSNNGIQLSLFDSIKDLLLIEPIFLLGIVFIGITLAIIFKKYRSIPKIKTIIVSLIMYYYFCLLLKNIVGIPTLNEYTRLLQLGEPIFNPNVNLIPLSDGLSLGFILNILLFVPLGFMCPLISKTYTKIKNTLFIGFGLSMLIEISQLFTLYRATDIDDLLTNVIGTIIGYLCFKVITKLRLVKSNSIQQSTEKDCLAYLPIIILLVAFVLGFFS